MKTLAITSLFLLTIASANADIRNGSEVLARIDGTPITRADLVASLPDDLRNEYTSRFEQLEDAKSRAVRDLIGRRTIEREAAEQHLSEQQVIDREYDKSRNDIAASFRAEIAGQEEELYNAEKIFLQRVIDDRRLARVAAAKHESVDQLTKEISASVPTPTADEVQFVLNYEMARRRLAGSNDPPEQQVQQAIRNARIDQKKRQLVDSAPQKPTVEVLLHAPRMVVNADDDPRRGPANAPVQIVMFSDFECHYCAQAEPVLARVRQTYGDKVAITFRDFPLPIHPMAMIAAKAANCANTSGKYWQFHDALFANQSQLSRAKIAEISDSLGLDRTQMAMCFETSAVASEIQHDIDDGHAYAVDSTPTFFVNGRMLVGTQTYERMASVIDEELSAVTR